MGKTTRSAAGSKASEPEVNPPPTFAFRKGKLVKPYSVSDWHLPRCEEKMYWGAIAKEEHIKCLVQDQDREELISTLNKCGLLKFLEKEPTGISTMDVVEFYNNSVLVVLDDETMLRTTVQGVQIELDWNTLADTFELRKAGNISSFPSFPDSTLEEMYAQIKNPHDSSSTKNFQTNSCRRKHILDVYNNIGYLISKYVDCQKGSFDQFSRKCWSTLKLIHDMNSGKGFQLNWGKAILEIITPAAKNFKASNCFDDDDEEPKVYVNTNLPLGLKICFLLERLGITLRDPRKIPGGSYVGKHQYQQAEKAAKDTDSSTVSKKRRSSSVAEQSVASSAPPQKKSKNGGKQSIKQAAKLPKTVITQVDDTTAKVVDTSVSVANQPNPDISKGVDLLADVA